MTEADDGDIRTYAKLFVSVEINQGRVLKKLRGAGRGAGLMLRKADRCEGLTLRGAARCGGLKLGEADRCGDLTMRGC